LNCRANEGARGGGIGVGNKGADQPIALTLIVDNQGGKAYCSVHTKVLDMDVGTRLL
jgi:hypothetical protein